MSPEGPARAGGRGLWIRIGVLAAVAAAGYALLQGPLSGLRSEEGWLALLASLRELPAAPLLVVGTCTALCLTGLPITPMILATGAIFGIWPGSLYNFATLCIGAAIGYWLGRTALRGTTEQLFGDRLTTLRRLLGRRGFWNLVRIRYVPIPYLFANLGLAACGVPWRPFMLSTALAMLPIAITWAALAGSIVQAGTGDRSAGLRNMMLALVLLFLLSFLPSQVLAWRRGLRYRDLLARRAARDGS